MKDPKYSHGITKGEFTINSLIRYTCLSCKYYKKINENTTLIAIKDSYYNKYMSMEFGCEAMEWVEEHHCWNCNTIFEFDNSNC